VTLLLVLGLSAFVFGALGFLFPAAWWFAGTLLVVLLVAIRSTSHEDIRWYS